MTALNLAFRNLYGYVIWGNSLGFEKKLVYRTGFDGRGVLGVRSHSPPVQQAVRDTEQKLSTPTPAVADSAVDDVEPQRPRTQLRLF